MIFVQVHLLDPLFVRTLQHVLQLSSVCFMLGVPYPTPVHAGIPAPSVEYSCTVCARVRWRVGAGRKTEVCLGLSFLSVSFAPSFHSPFS